MANLPAPLFAEILKICHPMKCLRTVFPLLLAVLLIGCESGKTYTAEDFDLEVLRSPSDYDEDGVDDYSDFVIGARRDAQTHPTYDGRYWEEGYPPDEIGVCADVIWRAFREAGYCLREMVDRDIALRLDAYYGVETPDSAIDFRRVRNLHVFFKEYGQSLSLDPDDLSEWQPGDIVVFGKDQHIGIVSDVRNGKGHTYIIHNGGQTKREEDYLARTTLEITGHYRFDASLVDPELLVPWVESDTAD